MTILEVKNLTKAYDQEHGIFNFDMRVDSGDIILLLGPNGAGKTTVFNSLTGLVKADYDQLLIKGRDLTYEDKKSIGAMISKPSFYEYMTAFDHLSLFAKLYGIKKTRVIEVLDMVGLAGAKDKKINKFSTGMKQRLDFARAIIHKPELLLLDEPFSGLDIEGKVEMKELLKNMTTTGIVISSHMVGDLESIANKLIIVNGGHIKYVGDMKTVTESGLSLEEFYIKKTSKLEVAS